MREALHLTVAQDWLCGSQVVAKYESKYSRMDQVKFVEDNL